MNIEIDVWIGLVHKKECEHILMQGILKILLNYLIKKKQDRFKKKGKNG